MINSEVTGDLLKCAEEGRYDLIVHGCNCFHTMGAGIAKQIKKQYPGAYLVDISHTIKSDSSKLGFYTFYDTGYFLIVNAYTQYDFRGRNNVDYRAIRTVFARLNRDYAGKMAGIPMIGAGLAGGDWGRIAAIINQVTPDLSIELVRYRSA